MQRLRWMIAPVLLVGFTACGSDSGGASTDEWCDLAKELDSDTSALDTIDFTDPESAKATFDDVADKLDQAVDAAPDEIKEAVETSKDAFAKLISVLEAADYDILDVDQDALSAAGPDFEAAGDKITAFNEKECGIAPDTDDTAAADDGSTDDTVASGTAREQMAKVFEGMGLDAEQAKCVSENVDPALASEAESNPAALFSVFETCGVSMADLAEIGQNSGG